MSVSFSVVPEVPGILSVDHDSGAYEVVKLSLSQLRNLRGQIDHAIKVLESPPEFEIIPAETVMGKTL